MSVLVHKNVYQSYMITALCYQLSATQIMLNTSELNLFVHHIKPLPMYRLQISRLWGFISLRPLLQKYRTQLMSPLLFIYPPALK